jgi:hypothetical protein
VQSYEFSATVEDGYIRVPDEFFQKNGTRIKVTVIPYSQADETIDALFPPIIDTKGWRFNREEANER